MRNKGGSVTADFTEINRIVEEYKEQLYAKIFYNLDEKIILERHKLLSMLQDKKQKI